MSNPFRDHPLQSVRTLQQVALHGRRRLAEPIERQIIIVRVQFRSLPGAQPADRRDLN